jgi:type VI secretion system secreted protein Hcp
MGATCLAVEGTAHADDWNMVAPVKGSAEYLRLDGIGGSSADKSHGGWIEISSFQWGASRPETSATGGAAAGRATLHDLRITKVIDASSPKLMQAAASGGHIKSAQIDFFRAAKTVYQIKLSDGLISGYSTSSGGDRPSESFTFTFAKIEVTYAKQNADGTLGAIQATPIGFDIKANVK